MDINFSNRHEKYQQLSNLISIGIALATEKDLYKLLDMILTEARRLTNSESGTLFLVEDNKLVYKIFHNEKMNIFIGNQGEKIELPSIPLESTFASSCAVNTRNTVNIKDVYDQTEYDFSIQKQHDKKMGYKTKSLLYVPLKKYDEDVLGIIQLTNAVNKETQEIIDFNVDKQFAIESLSSLAAIAIYNAELANDVELMTKSFVHLMITAFESRTPYNATHTEKVTKLTYLIAKEINDEKEGVFKDITFNTKDLEVITYASWFHDIGKVAIPIEIMNKSSKFGDKIELVIQRMNYVIERIKNSCLEKKIELLQSKKIEEIDKLEIESGEKIKNIENVKKILLKINTDKELTNEETQILNAVKTLKYLEKDGKEEFIFDKYIIDRISIEKGNLTDEERNLMKNHVLITEKMLSKIYLSKRYKRVPEIAIMHHEQPNGKGYPKQLKGDEICLEARILRVADIFDALTATDRPYKKTMEIEKVIDILNEMVMIGELDKDVTELVIRKRVWEKVSNLKLIN